MSKQTVIAAFNNASDARKALKDLRRDDFRDKQIGVLSHGKEGDNEFKSFKELEGNHAGKGAAAGAVAGAGTGVVWSLGIAAGLLPAIGPVIAGGILGALAASGAAGAAVGGVAGALVGLGISDEDAAYYEGELERGSTVVVVKAKDDREAAHAMRIFQTRGGYHRSKAA